MKEIRTRLVLAIALNLGLNFLLWKFVLLKTPANGLNRIFATFLTLLSVIILCWFCSCAILLAGSFTGQLIQDESGIYFNERGFAGRLTKSVWSPRLRKEFGLCSASWTMALNILHIFSLLTAIRLLTYCITTRQLDFQHLAMLFSLSLLVCGTTVVQAALLRFFTGPKQVLRGIRVFYWLLVGIPCVAGGLLWQVSIHRLSLLSTLIMLLASSAASFVVLIGVGLILGPVLADKEQQNGVIVLDDTPYPAGKASGLCPLIKRG